MTESREPQRERPLVLITGATGYVGKSLQTNVCQGLAPSDGSMPQLKLRNGSVNGYGLKLVVSG